MCVCVSVFVREQWVLVSDQGARYRPVKSLHCAEKKAEHLVRNGGKREERGINTRRGDTFLCVSYLETVWRLKAREANTDLFARQI